MCLGGFRIILNKNFDVLGSLLTSQCAVRQYSFHLTGA